MKTNLIIVLSLVWMPFLYSQSGNGRDDSILGRGDLQSKRQKDHSGTNLTDTAYRNNADDLNGRIMPSIPSPADNSANNRHQSVTTGIQQVPEKMTVKNSSGQLLLDITDEGGFGSITIPSGSAVAVPDGKLYNLSGTLYWNGTELEAGGQNWNLTGNSGTDPAVNFLGTVDAQALEFRVNNQRALRINPSQSVIVPDAPNMIAGCSANVVSAAFGVTIGGGGRTDFLNVVSANAGTVSGGYGNQSTAWGSFVGGGLVNTAGGGFFWGCAVVSGGERNDADSDYGTIGGGKDNSITDDDGTIAHHSTIGGGENNVIEDAHHAVIPGGGNNAVTGNYSFAAGRRAKANHAGCFVWADNEDADFATQKAKSFIVRASGGVGIGLNNPQYPLHMASGAYVSVAGIWTDASSREYKENIKDLSLADALSALEVLRPKSFNYKADKDDNCLGFIAEDVPDLVASKDRKGLSSMDIVTVVTRVVQQQQLEIMQLKAKIEELENK
ncbi:tail fiber domain-containing protein [candidate division KSB1 bacterium]|nr:tail fiber domain-containing protein [candidate division KSB1 bacterium]